MSRCTAFLVVGAVTGFGLASCTSKPLCTESAQCQSAESCLPSGACAHACTTRADCLSTEKCSASGGCVAVNGGCGTDSDCSADQTCQSGGTCATSVSRGSGGGGEAGGSAGIGGASGQGGGGQGGGQGDGQCAETFTSTATQANLMIVLDKSASMNGSVGGVTKWRAAVEAVTMMTNRYPSIHFGLEMFSAPLLCSTGTINVPIGAGTASQIQQALPALGDGVGTPIAGGLSVASKDPGLLDPTRSNGVVLITDGMENCLGNPEAEVDALFKRAVSVRTFVVGFGGVGNGGVDADVLTSMAIKGGTARIATPRYYQADIPADLQTALTAISNAAQGCSFLLSKAPDDVSKLFIAINGQLVPHDPNRVSGWEYDPATRRATLYGPSCDALANTPGAQLSIQYGCSDGLIEGGSDGGFDFDIG